MKYRYNVLVPVYTSQQRSNHSISHSVSSTRSTDHSKQLHLCILPSTSCRYFPHVPASMSPPCTDSGYVRRTGMVHVPAYFNVILPVAKVWYLTYTVLVEHLVIATVATGSTSTLYINKRAGYRTSPRH